MRGAACTAANAAKMLMSVISAAVSRQDIGLNFSLQTLGMLKYTHPILKHLLQKVQVIGFIYGFWICDWQVILTRIVGNVSELAFAYSKFAEFGWKANVGNKLSNIFF